MWSSQENSCHGISGCPAAREGTAPGSVLYCNYSLHDLSQGYMESSEKLGLDLQEFDRDFDAFNTEQKAKQLSPPGDLEKKKKTGFHPGAGKDWRWVPCFFFFLLPMADTDWVAGH
jgi:hypothetical protein